MVMERLRRYRVLRLGGDGRRLVRWFDLDPRVEVRLVADLAPGRLPEADATIATAWQTAAPVAEAAAGGGGFYLIQHVEDWNDPETVRDTWRLALHKIVIAGWLREIAVEIGEGERTSLVPNGLDFEHFGVDLPPPEREPRVGALISPFKGFEDVVAALTAARRALPDLTAATYGTRPRPPDLPEWATYLQLPSQAELRALYNSCSIFLQASRSEGWGLPATEAMACGCALVTYDNGGSREYASDGATALVIGDGGGPAELAGALVRLGSEPELRLALAEAGRERVETFTWERATERLERVLREDAAGGGGGG
jgi:glycosyltransferase involved in cell wall biosynthesis